MLIRERGQWQNIDNYNIICFSSLTLMVPLLIFCNVGSENGWLYYYKSILGIKKKITYLLKLNFEMDITISHKTESYW